MVGFAWLPPETNSLRMYLGAGSRPLLAAAGAWDGLAEELHAAASSFGSVTSELPAALGRDRRRPRWRMPRGRMRAG